MNLSDLQHQYSKVISLLEKRHIKEALIELTEMLNKSSESQPIKATTRSTIETISATYNYMLQYFANGAEDSQRQSILSDIILKLYLIADGILYGSMYADSTSQYYSNCRRITLSGIDFSSYLDKYSKIYAAYNDSSDKSLLNRLEEYESEIFKYIWATPDVDRTLFSSIISDSTPTHFKSLVLSALMLSAMGRYNENKILVLIDAYLNSSDESVQITALVALTLLSFLYNDRMLLSKEISELLTCMHQKDFYQSDIKSILLSFMQSFDTKRISNKINNEIIPELMKIRPEIEKKIKDIDIASTDNPDTNPNWQNLIAGSNLEKKLREINDMQLEGADIMMTSFAHLKKFPFFNNITNWFMPFHENHSALTDNSLSDIAKTLSEMPMMCDSDKFSFIFAAASIPATQRNMMLSQISSQKESLREMLESELKTEEVNRAKTIERYIRNCYRFFHLNEYHLEFHNPFHYLPYIDKSALFDGGFDSTEGRSIISEFLFRRKYYGYAAKVFIDILQTENPSAQILQKIGFCFQNEHKYSEALEYYLKAVILDGDDAWTLRHIAQCHKERGNNTEALKYFKEAETLQPDNLNLLMNIANLILEKGEPREALKYYYKIDYLASNQKKTLRPIAWCEFLTGNYERSIEQYAKINDNDKTAHDFINLGHLMMVQNNIPKAVEYYNKSKLKMSDLSTFNEDFNKDVPYLLKAGVAEDTISMMHDVVCSPQNS